MFIIALSYGVEFARPSSAQTPALAWSFSLLQVAWGFYLI